MPSIILNGEIYEDITELKLFDNNGVLQVFEYSGEPQPGDSYLSEDYLIKLKNAGVPLVSEMTGSTINTLRFTKDSQYAIEEQKVNANIGEGITAYYDSVNRTINIYSPNDIKMFDCRFDIEHGNIYTLLINYDAFVFDGSGETVHHLYLDNLDTSEMTDMTSMFSMFGSGAYNIPDLDVSGLNTSNVTNMYCLFSGLIGTESLDLSNFDLSNVTNMNDMFSLCSDLTNIYVSQENSDWTNLSVTSSDNMFNGCELLPNYDENATDISMAKLSTNGGYFTLKGEPIQGETWIFNDTPSITSIISQTIRFSVGNIYDENNYYTMIRTSNITPTIYYHDESLISNTVYVAPNGWFDRSYKTVTFEESVDLTSEFGQWLSQNATKQDPTLQIQLNVPYTVTRSEASIGEGSTLTFKNNGTVRIVGTVAPIDADFSWYLNPDNSSITID